MTPLTPSRAGIALIAGAAASATLWTTVSFLRFSEPIATMLLILLLAFLVWLAGAVMLAAPLWLWLHRSGLTHWSIAFLLGLAVGFAAFLALNTDFFGLLYEPPPFGTSSTYGDGNGQIEVNGILTPYGWQFALRSSLAIGVCSGLGGLVTWFVAYRRH